MNIKILILLSAFVQFSATIAMADFRCVISEICTQSSACAKVKYVYVVSDLGDGIVLRMVDQETLKKLDFEEVSDDGTRWFTRIDGKLEDVRIVALRENGSMVTTRYTLNEQSGSLVAVQNVASCVPIANADTVLELQVRNYETYARDFCPLIKPNPRTNVTNKTTGKVELAPFKVHCFCHYNYMISSLTDDELTALLPLIGKDIDDDPSLGRDFIDKVRSAVNKSDKACIQEILE